MLKGLTMTTKQKRARQRQKRYDLLTPQEKLARLDASGFGAVKERLALHEAILGVRWP